MKNRIKHFFALVYWFFVRPKTRGVKCVVIHDGKVLMIKNSYGGWKKWMFPGGGIDRDETPEQAVEREVFEEVGVKVLNVHRIGEYSSTKEFKRDTVIVFACDSECEEVRIDPQEIAEAKWFLLQSLPDISEYSTLIVSMLMKDRQHGLF